MEVRNNYYGTTLTTATLLLCCFLFVGNPTNQLIFFTKIKFKKKKYVEQRQGLSAESKVPADFHFYYSTVFLTRLQNFLEQL